MARVGNYADYSPALTPSQRSLTWDRGTAWGRHSATSLDDFFFSYRATHTLGTRGLIIQKVFEWLPNFLGLPATDAAL